MVQLLKQSSELKQTFIRNINICFGSEGSYSGARTSENTDLTVTSPRVCNLGLM